MQTSVSINLRSKLFIVRKSPSTDILTVFESDHAEVSPLTTHSDSSSFYFMCLWVVCLDTHKILPALSPWKIILAIKKGLHLLEFLFQLNAMDLTNACLQDYFPSLF